MTNFPDFEHKVSGLRNGPRGVPDDPADFALWSIKRHLDAKAAGKYISQKGIDRVLPEIELLAPYLEALEIRHTDIKGISAVGTLKNLKTLTLNKSPIESLAPLANLENLTELSISRVRSAGETLPNIPSLRTLKVGDSKVNTLGGPNGFPNLETLSINGALTDPELLRGKTKLKSLSLLPSYFVDDLNGIGTGDLTVIGTLQNLESLELLDKTTIDLAPLSALNALTTAQLSFEVATDISPLSKLINLQTLALSCPAAQDHSPLGALQNLTVLRINSSSQLSDISWLSSLQSLKTLAIAVTDQTDLGPLQALPNLSFLILHISGTPDLSALSQLTTVTNLVLTADETTTRLNKMPAPPNLLQLSLQGTCFDTLDGIQDATQLHRLQVAKTSIFDITPLYGMKQLRGLNLAGTKVDDLSVLKSLPCFIYPKAGLSLNVVNTPAIERYPALKRLPPPDRDRDGILGSFEIAQEISRIVLREL